MPFRDYREESKTRLWGTERDGNLSGDEVKLGAILRIADSLEEEAGQKIRAIERLAREVANLEIELEHVERSAAAYKGMYLREKRRNGGKQK